MVLDSDERASRGRSSPVRMACTKRATLGRPSPRTATVGMEFGIPLYAEPRVIVEPTSVPLAPGRIVLLLGPSGSGKTSALAAIERQRGGGVVVDRVRFDRDRAIVDAIAPAQPLGEALGVLSACALGEPGLWIRRFNELSDGERFRARLARAISLHRRGTVAAPLLCDEFCSVLHRRVAKAISFNLRKIVSRDGLSAVVAGSNDDIVADLRPDIIVRLTGRGMCCVEPREWRRRSRPTFATRPRIEAGSLRDYAAFSQMHYRSTDQLALVDKVFVMSERRTNDPPAGGQTSLVRGERLLGIVVYGYSPLELSLRRTATNGRFTRNPARLNRSFRILRRLVVHPDVRGCGLGHYLVRKTLPMVGTEFVECLATMGEINPVFEKAGMKRIGRYDVQPSRKKAIDALRAMDVSPSSREFPGKVCRSRRVRAIVARVVHDWYRSTTSEPDVRMGRQSPHQLAEIFRGLIGLRPVYYLWKRPTRRPAAARRPARSRKAKAETEYEG